MTGSGALGFQNNLLGVGIEIGDTFGQGNFVREPDGTLFSQLQYGEHRYDLQDALGSVVNLATDTATSAGDFAYEPWGKFTATGQTSTNFFNYAGGMYINGYVHFGQRYYDAANANWTQSDLIDQPKSLTSGNRYAYAGDDPINNVDPGGLFLKMFFRSARKISLKTAAESVVTAAGCSLVPAGPAAAAVCGAGLVLTSADIQHDLRNK